MHISDHNVLLLLLSEVRFLIDIFYSSDFSIEFSIQIIYFDIFFRWMFYITEYICDFCSRVSLVYSRESILLLVKQFAYLVMFLLMFPGLYCVNRPISRRGLSILCSILIWHFVLFLSLLVLFSLFKGCCFANFFRCFTYTFLFRLERVVAPQ